MSRPTFMDHNLPDTDPGLDDLAVGSEIVVIEPSYHRRRVEDPQPIRAVVTSKARIWITAKQINNRSDRYRRFWRFRMDDQTDGSVSTYAPRFYTPEQYLASRVSETAWKYLGDQGIRVDLGSPWRNQRRTIELARAVWAIDNQESEGR